MAKDGMKGSDGKGQVQQIEKGETGIAFRCSYRHLASV
jgi:hypothetical protein